MKKKITIASICMAGCLTLTLVGNGFLSAFATDGPPLIEIGQGSEDYPESKEIDPARAELPDVAEDEIVVVEDGPNAADAVALASDGISLQSVLPAPGNVTASIDGDKIYMNWDSVEGAEFYELYVRKADSEFMAYGPPLYETTYNTSVETLYALFGDSFVLALIAVDADGNESEFSSEVVVSVGGEEPAIPAPTSLKAEGTDVELQVRLTWSEVSVAKGYIVYVSDTADGEYEVVDEVTTNSYLAGGHEIGKTYYYKVVAYTDDGHSDMSGYCAVTFKSDEIVAPAPTNVKFAVADGRVTITWDNSEHADGYDIYRAPAGSDSFQLIASPTASPYVDSVPAGEYYYYIQSKKGGELGEKTEPVLVDATGTPVTIPAPSNVKFTVADGKVTITWDKANEADGYDIYRAPAGSNNFELIASPTASPYVDTVIAGEYYYYIQSKKGGELGEKTEPSLVEVADTPVEIPAPTNAAAVPGENNVTITWTPVAEADGYDIYRSSDDGANFKLAGSSKTGSFVDGNLEPGKYIYYIQSKKGSQLGSKSGQITATVEGSAITDEPRNVKATLSGKNVVISWEGGTGADLFIINRSTTPGGIPDMLYSAFSSPFTDKNLAPGTYYYTVNSVRGAYEGPRSEEVKVVVQSDPVDDYVTTPGNLQVAPSGINGAYLTWDAVPEATGYLVYRSTTEYGNYERIAILSDNYYTNKGLKLGQTYYYTVVAYNNKNTSGYAVPVHIKIGDDIDIPAPANVQAVADGKYTIQVSWQIVSGVEGYYVYRANAEGGPYTMIGSTQVNYYPNYGLTPNTTYYYKVVAHKDGLLSPESNIASATTEDDKPPEKEPVSPLDLIAKGISSSAINLTVIEAPGNQNDGYYFYMSLTRNGTYTQVYPDASGNVTGLASKTTYYFTVRPYVGNKIGDITGPVSATTTGLTLNKCMAPVCLKVKEIGTGTMRLTWSRYCKDYTIHDGYRIYRSTSKYGPWELVGNTTSRTFIDTGLNQKTKYYYYVESYNSTHYGNSTVACDTTHTLHSPDTLSVKAYSYNSIKLSWDKCHGEDVLVNIYRSTSANGPFELINTIPTTSSYIDSGVTRGVTYYYKVENVGGNAALMSKIKYARAK